MRAGAGAADDAVAATRSGARAGSDLGDAGRNSPVPCRWIRDDMDDMDDYKEFEGFIWDELAKGNTVEMKLIWPSDDELKKVVEQARKDLRWKLERAVAVRSDDLFEKRKKRKR